MSFAFHPPPISPTDADIFAAMRSFLLGVVPSGTEVIKAQVNRVPEPRGLDFVLMNSIGSARLETNVDTVADIILTASIAETGPLFNSPATMTVTAIQNGTLVPGNPLSAPTIFGETHVSRFLTGQGGTGTYEVTPSRVFASGLIYAGQSSILTQTQVDIQLDVHGPTSADNARRIVALLRSEYGVDAFKASNPNIAPLYSSDARQGAFVNAEQQYEDRWIVTASLQASVVTIVGQQFADQMKVGLVNVDAAYLA